MYMDYFVVVIFNAKQVLNVKYRCTRNLSTYEVGIKINMLDSNYKYYILVS